MRILRPVVVCVFSLIVGLGYTSAQSNDQIDSILSQTAAKADTVSYIVLTATKTLAEEALPSDAFQAAVDGGFLQKTKKADDPINLEELSYFLMKALKVPGGLQWSFLPNPRAAYLELSYRKVINSSGGPYRLIPGDEVLRVLRVTLDLQEGQK